MSRISTRAPRACWPNTTRGARRTARGVIAFTDGLVRMFANPLASVRRLRNLGLLAFDLLPPAKAALSRLSTGGGRTRAEAGARRGAAMSASGQRAISMWSSWAPASSALPWRACSWPAGCAHAARVAVIADRFARHRAGAGCGLGLARVRTEPRLGAAARSCAAFGTRCRRSGSSPTSACACGMPAAQPTARARSASTALKSASRISDTSSRAARCSGDACRRRGPRAPCSSRPGSTAVIVHAMRDISVRLSDGRELRSRLLIGGRRQRVEDARRCSASRPPATPIIKTRWWRMCAPPSLMATPLGSDSCRPGRWLSCRSPTAALPSCGAPTLAEAARLRALERRGVRRGADRGQRRGAGQHAN